jgi:hypothetical protein
MRSLLSAKYLSPDVLRELTTLAYSQASNFSQYQWYFLLCNRIFLRLLSQEEPLAGDLEDAMQDLAAAAIRGLEAVEIGRSGSVMQAANQMTMAFIAIESCN